MNPILGTLIRAALNALAGLLVTHGYLHPDEQGTLVNALLPAVLALVSVGWSVVEKQRRDKLLQTAMELPAGVSLETVKQIAQTPTFKK